MSNKPRPNTALPVSTVAELEGVETLIGQGQLAAAAQALNRLQQRYPSDPRIYLLGSLLAERSDRGDAMLASAERASRLAPHWHVATLRLAQAQGLAGQDKAALKNAQVALQQSQKHSTSERQDILRAAVDLAIQHGAYDQARDGLQQLLKLAPQAVAPRVQLAQILAHTGQTEAGLQAFAQVLESAPETVPARIGHMHCAQQLGQTAVAEADAAYLRQHHASDPQASFHAAVVLGEKPATQPPALIAQLFDDYAHLFDQHLVRGLGYTLPRDVAQRILQWHPDRQLNLLDLGCGTGLLGVCLGRLQGALIGVELSGNMVRKAARHGVYDRFHQVNLIDALRDTPADLYHVIAALDVLCYVGDLAAVIPQAWRVLVPGGRWVFSCEALTSGRSHYTIDPQTLRYQHARSYVEKLCQKAGFVDIDIQELSLRKQDQDAVPGFLVVATKPAQSIAS